MTDRGYARISLDNERSGSIAKQRAQIARFGSEVTFYVDESVSGSKIPFAQRPAGAELLRDLRAGDRVLVTKIDRAARNVRDLLSLVETIDEAGASIVFVEQNIDTSGPIGKFILVILAAIAELEADIIGERRRESLAAFAQEGRHAVGRAPFGFESVPNPNGRGLVIRPDRAPSPDLGDRSPAEVLREAIERVLAGEAQARVVEGLPMEKAGFSVLLRNPRLAGMTPTPDGGVVTIDGVPRVDSEAALLTMAEWAELREHLNRPVRKPWAHQDGYGAVLTCAACGMRLYKSVSAQRAEYSVYKCGRAKHERGSASASVTVLTADAYVEETFLALHGDRQVVLSVVVDDEAAKIEAISLASMQLEEVRRRQDAATTDEEEDELAQAYRQAKRALRKARELPNKRTFRAEYAGETVAERWARSNDAERCRMLTVAGAWLVHPGRVPIEQKIELRPDDMLVELLTRAVGEGDDAPVGFILD